jgi:hypothetical protein
MASPVSRAAPASSAGTARHGTADDGSGTLAHWHTGTLAHWHTGRPPRLAHYCRLRRRGRGNQRTAHAELKHDPRFRRAPRSNDCLPRSAIGLVNLSEVAARVWRCWTPCHSITGQVGEKPNQVATNVCIHLAGLVPNCRPDAGRHRRCRLPLATCRLQLAIPNKLTSAMLCARHGVRRILGTPQIHVLGLLTRPRPAWPSAPSPICRGMASGAELNSSVRLLLFAHKLKGASDLVYVHQCTSITAWELILAAWPLAGYKTRPLHLQHLRRGRAR